MIVLQDDRAWVVVDECCELRAVALYPINAWRRFLHTDGPVTGLIKDCEAQGYRCIECRLVPIEDKVDKVDS